MGNPVALVPWVSDSEKSPIFEVQRAIGANFLTNLFWGREGSPTKIDRKKVGTHFLSPKSGGPSPAREGGFPPVALVP